VLGNEDVNNNRNGEFCCTFAVFVLKTKNVFQLIIEFYFLLVLDKIFLNIAFHELF
jgi:hypothetical protein